MSQEIKQDTNKEINKALTSDKLQAARTDNVRPIAAGAVEKYTLRGLLAQATAWPIIAEIGFAITVLLFFIFERQFWWIVLIAFGLFSLFTVIFLIRIRRGMLKDVVAFSADYSKVQHRMLNAISIPYATLDEKGRVLFLNKAMCNLTGETKDFNKNIAGIFKEITPKEFPVGNETAEVWFDYKAKHFKGEIKKIRTAGGMEYIGLLVHDESRYKLFTKKLKDDSFAVALIDIDNYEDSIEGIDDRSQSYVTGLLDKRIYDYFGAGGAFVRKLEKDRYIAVCRHKDLDDFTADHFNILDIVKDINLNNDMEVSLSIGVATGLDTYNQSYETAKNSLELALGRGGDQAVVRDGDKVSYFGGKRQQTETNTRVKMRVKAHALRKIFESKERVIIMGHHLPDIDAFGAAVGMHCFAKYLGKEAYVVINDIMASVKPFYERFTGREGYGQDSFIRTAEAIEKTDSKTVVVVVDVNKPEMTDCPEILDMCDTKVVFDHHRAGEEPIKGVVLSYVDPNASSSCEMITEMMEFGSMDLKLKGFEADAIYAGIVVDTDNFNTKTGPRTFEASAYLRRNGADVTRVRKLLRSDPDESRAVAEAVGNAQMYLDEYAITCYYDDKSVSPVEGCAKTANQLIDIAGVRAAFAVTRNDDKIHVSARSIDEINVQRVMERIGGGGHLSTAGAQLSGVDESEAIQLIKDTLDDMIKEGEI